MFFIESRVQVLELVKAAKKTAHIPALVIPHGLFTGYPLSWTVALLDETLPFIDKIELGLQAHSHRGRLLQLLAARPALPWQVINTFPTHKAGLFLLTDDPCLAKRLLAIP